MQVYCALKTALQQYGEYTMATVERVFKDKAKAEEYIKSGVPIVWEETVQGITYKCERGICEVELEE